MIVPGNTIKLDFTFANGLLTETTSQSPISKALRGIKKKRTEAFIKIQTPGQQDEGKDQKRKGSGSTSGRGIVYIGHLPDGFFEEQLHQYFSQFGTVTRVKVARSKKTGKSKGYAFIEFLYSEVAKVVAETMDNYLLFNRLLKANYVDKEYPAAFWNQKISPEKCPRTVNRALDTQRKNATLSASKEMAQHSRRRRRLAGTLSRLRAAGLDYTVQVRDEIPLPKGMKAAKEEEEKQKATQAAIKAAKNLPELKQPVLEIDESDTEIDFNVPSFVIRKTVKRQSSVSPQPETPNLKKKKGSKDKRDSDNAAKENIPTPSEQNESLGRKKRRSNSENRFSITPNSSNSAEVATLSSKKKRKGKRFSLLTADLRENQKSDLNRSSELKILKTPVSQKGRKSKINSNSEERSTNSNEDSFTLFTTPDIEVNKTKSPEMNRVLKKAQTPTKSIKANKTEVTAVSPNSFPRNVRSPLKNVQQKNESSVEKKSILKQSPNQVWSSTGTPSKEKSSLSHTAGSEDRKSKVSPKSSPVTSRTPVQSESLVKTHASSVRKSKRLSAEKSKMFTGSLKKKSKIPVVFKPSKKH